MEGAVGFFIGFVYPDHLFDDMLGTDRTFFNGFCIADQTEDQMISALRSVNVEAAFFQCLR